MTQALGLGGELYGFTGVLLGSVMYSFPVAFLMLSDAMKYTDASLYEAAEVLGVPPVRRFTSITMYFMKRPLISAVFAVFTMVFTDYGVPLAVGGRFATLPVYLYTEVIGLLDFSKGAFIGLVLLIPAIVTFLIDLRRKEHEGMGFVSRRLAIKKNLGRDIGLGAFCLLVLVAVGLVLGSFAAITFMAQYPYDTSFTLDHIVNTASRGMLGFFGNSLTMSALVALFLAPVSPTSPAYVTARTTSRCSPGCCSFQYRLAGHSRHRAGPWLRDHLQEHLPVSTLFILVLVNTIHFFASPYMMAHNAMKKMKPTSRTWARRCAWDGATRFGMCSCQTP